jgi:hypothetical protein
MRQQALARMVQNQRGKLVMNQKQIAQAIGSERIEKIQKICVKIGTDKMALSVSAETRKPCFIVYLDDMEKESQVPKDVDGVKVFVIPAYVLTFLEGGVKK